MVVVVPVIFGMMRIKDEARWIENVLESLLKVADQVLIMDDHSTDDTVAICRSFGPRVDVIESPFEGLEETRDKNWLLGKLAEVAKPNDPVVCIDGDEEIAAGSHEEIRQLAAMKNGADAYRFQILYLWDDPQHIRVDGIYGRFTRSSFFRYRPGAKFVSRTAGGFHCGNVPEPIALGVSGVKILHYGYMHKEDRIRKWKFYSGIDPTNRAEGYDPKHPERLSYCHVVQGDVPEVPASAVLMHGGPLRLQPISRLGHTQHA